MTLVEHDQAVASVLRAQLALLQADDQVSLVATTAQAYLERCAHLHDLVFLDPPFTDWAARPDRLGALFRQVDERLAPSAHIYLEAPAEEDLAGYVPAHWAVLRERRFGSVQAVLHAAGPRSTT